MSNPRRKNVGGRCAGRKGKLLFSAPKKRCHCEERSDVAIPLFFLLSSRASAASRGIWRVRSHFSFVPCVDPSTRCARSG